MESEEKKKNLYSIPPLLVIFQSVMHKWDTSGRHADWRTPTEFVDKVSDLWGYKSNTSTASRWIQKEKSFFEQPADSELGRRPSIRQRGQGAKAGRS